MDPIDQMFSPYAYTTDNPINSVDVEGESSIGAVVYSDRSAVLTVLDKNNKIVGTFNALAKGQMGRDWRMTDADTPFGVYDIAGWNPAPTSAARKRPYGPQPRLVLNGISGDIVTSKRNLIRIQGGDLDMNGNLRPTKGYIRMLNGDVVSAKTLLDNLQKLDPEDVPAILTGESYIPPSKEVPILRPSPLPAKELQV